MLSVNLLIYTLSITYRFFTTILIQQWQNFRLINVSACKLFLSTAKKLSFLELINYYSSNLQKTVVDRYGVLFVKRELLF